MQKSLAEFLSLPESELIRLVAEGPLLITQDHEPRFVAQSIDAFESMVRRLRELESTLGDRKVIRRARVIPLRP
jgi:hypothetical protein